MAVAQLGGTALNAPAIPRRKNAQGTGHITVAVVRNAAIHRPRNRIRLGDQDSEQGHLPVADQSARSAAHLLRNSKKLENHSHACARKTTHPGELALERSHIPTLLPEPVSASAAYRNSGHDNTQPYDSQSARADVNSKQPAILPESTAHKHSLTFCKN